MSLDTVGTEEVFLLTLFCGREKIINQSANGSEVFRSSLYQTIKSWTFPNMKHLKMVNQIQKKTLEKKAEIDVYHIISFTTKFRKASFLFL